MAPLGLGYGPRKEDGPVQHPGTTRVPQPVYECSQQRQRIEQIHQHRDPREDHRILEVRLILVDIGEAGIQRTVKGHLSERERE